MRSTAGWVLACALGAMIHTAAQVAAIRIRYADTEAIDGAGVEPFVKALLASERGATQSFVFWAEALSVPALEAYIYFEDGSTPGYLLVWSARAVYRDSSGKWWFSTSPPVLTAK